MRTRHNLGTFTRRSSVVKSREELVQETAETTGARWFQREELRTIELSTDRITQSQILTLLRFAENPELAALCD
jgi:hypothetical protein